MSGARSSASGPRPSVSGTAWPPGALFPQLRSWHFWAIQALVVAIAGIHAVIETVETFQAWTLPFLLPTGFFLVPVVYAALAFGLSAALITALWAGVLSVPNMVIFHDGVESFGEAFQVVIIVVVAFFVGREVDRVKSARQQAESVTSELKASRMRYRSLFESSPLAILVLSNQGVILEANPAASLLFSIAKNSLEGMAITDLLGAAETQRVLASPSRGEWRTDPITVKQADGTELYLEPMTNPLSDGQDGLITELLLRNVTHEHGVRAGMRAYTAYMTRAQEEERQRIARELHDQTIQSVIFICRRLDNVQDEGGALPPAVRDSIQKARNTAEEVVRELRDFTMSLRPPALDDLGLTTSMRRLVSDFVERTGIAGKFRTAGLERRLPADTELGLFRITQESLWNVEHHSGASRIAVTLTFAGREARLEVIDNGKGFAADASPLDMSSSGHFGLMSMQERAKLLGGTLTIRSSPGKGALVIVSIPVPDELSEDEAGASGQSSLP